MEKIATTIFPSNSIPYVGERRQELIPMSHSSRIQGQGWLLMPS